MKTPPLAIKATKKEKKKVGLWVSKRVGIFCSKKRAKKACDFGYWLAAERGRKKRKIVGFFLLATYALEVKEKKEKAKRVNSFFLLLGE